MTYSITLKGWPKGVDNVHASYELPADSLRSGVNVDILDSGKIRRRLGRTSAVVAVDAHSLWSHRLLTNSYYVSGTTLYSLDKSMVSTTVVSGLMFGRGVAYLYLNGEVFWSNGINSGRIRNGLNTPWGIETPAGNATLTATAGGLPPGAYQVVTTFKNAAGEESGSQNTQKITLVTTGGISMTNLPSTTNPEMVYQCIYVTATNDDKLHKVAQLPIAQTSYTIASAGVPTVHLKTFGLSPMPGGTILAYLNGTIFAANGKYIFYSEPLRYGLCYMSRNFFQFSSDVTIMLSVTEGLHVCADKTYFISAPETAEVSQVMTLPYGAFKGTGTYLPGDTGVAWFSERGQVIAKGPAVEAVTEKVFIPWYATSGASFVREQQGLKQIVTVTHQTEINPLEYTGARP